MVTFNDHFSGQSREYAHYRPDYPKALFDYLLGLVRQPVLAWDCATGSGQAAQALAESFRQVVATDASAAQIAQASDIVNVEFHCVPAESSGLETHSVDLITVAQAIHWFDFESFYEEVRRVLKPGGIVAIWCYGLSTIRPDIDQVIGHYYGDIIDDYWPPERVYIEHHYQDIPFPFEEFVAPRFSMSKMWTLDDLLGYLDTWSATQRYKADKGDDPREQIIQPLVTAWGGADIQRPVCWPISLRVGKVS